MQWSPGMETRTSNVAPFLQKMKKEPSQADSPQIAFEPLPLYPIQCQQAGLLEHWIEPTLQVGSILMGYLIRGSELLDLTADLAIRIGIGVDVHIGVP